MLSSLLKIAVVEDHSFYRNGLCLAIKRFKFAELVFEASNGFEFIEKQREKPVDIVLLDIMMPVMNGYDTVIESKKEFPGLKIIILTMLEEDESIEQFIKAGVQGYLLKNIDNKGLEKALKAVASGQNYYSKELMGFFTRKLRGEYEKPKNDSLLTKRELEILKLVFDGLSNQEIADKLFVSIRTVTNHRYNLNIKTSAKNTAGLISYGLKNKLIQ
jgi:DNA-binding NarL/FixJ family response regulator